MYIDVSSKCSVCKSQSLHFNDVRKSLNCLSHLTDIKTLKIKNVNIVCPLRYPIHRHYLLAVHGQNVYFFGCDENFPWSFYTMLA